MFEKELYNGIPNVTVWHSVRLQAEWPRFDFWLMQEIIFFA
jgi:hypothetical protein